MSDTLKEKVLEARKVVTMDDLHLHMILDEYDRDLATAQRLADLRSRDVYAAAKVIEAQAAEISRLNMRLSAIDGLIESGRSWNVMVPIPIDELLSDPEELPLRPVPRILYWKHRVERTLE